jgi:hypothetical protein
MVIMIGITKHAEQRIKQRGFSETHIQLLEVFGEQNRKPGGALELMISKKKRAEIVQALDKAVRKSLIISDDGSTLITVINRG